MLLINNDSQTQEYSACRHHKLFRPMRHGRSFGDQPVQHINNHEIAVSHCSAAAWRRGRTMRLLSAAVHRTAQSRTSWPSLWFSTSRPGALWRHCRSSTPGRSEIRSSRLVASKKLARARYALTFVYQDCLDLSDFSIRVFTL